MLVMLKLQLGDREPILITGEAVLTCLSVTSLIEVTLQGVLLLGCFSFFLAFVFSLILSFLLLLVAFISLSPLSLK